MIMPMSGEHDGGLASQPTHHTKKTHIKVRLSTKKVNYFLLKTVVAVGSVVAKLLLDTDELVVLGHTVGA